MPTAGTSCDNNPAEIPKANGEGNPIIKKDIVKAMLASIPRITLAAIHAPAFDTPIVQT